VSEKKTLNERFTEFADWVSETIGKWWVTAISLLVLFAWLALGPLMHFSDSWQLAANTPTTWIELFLGFIIAAAANRVEKRNKALQEQQMKIIRHIESTAAREEQEVADAEKRLLKEDRRMEAIMDHLDKQDAMILHIAQRLDEEQKVRQP
jgi:low affinity Fe/Cu permease